MRQETTFKSLGNGTFWYSVWSEGRLLEKRILAKLVCDYQN